MQNPITLHSLSGARQGAGRGRRLGVLAMAIALGSLPFGSACTKVQNDNSSSYLIVDSLSAASGADPKVFGQELGSDVVTCVKKTGAPAFSVCPAETQYTVISDIGKVKLSLGLKDPGLSPTSANYITINRYHIDYVRSDGGSGVPASVDSAISFTVDGAGVEGSFTIVTVLAKESAPLAALVSGGEIRTIATVTFYGKDQAGRSVQVTATMGVSFSNYGDPATRRNRRHGLGFDNFKVLTW